MGSEDDNLEMPTYERLDSLATSQASVRRFRVEERTGRSSGKKG